MPRLIVFVGLLALSRGQFPSLTSLDVGCETLTDAALVDLGNLASLRTLNFWNCVKITNKGALLAQQLTGLSPDDSMNTRGGTYLFVRK